MVMFRQVPIAAIFLHSFYIVVCSVFKGKGKSCHGPTLGDPLEKSETDTKGRPFFKDHMFLGQKIDKTGTDLNL